MSEQPRQIFLTYPTRAALLDAYAETPSPPALRVPIDDGFVIGEQLNAEILIAEDLMLFQAHLVARQRLVRPPPGVEPHVRLEFAPNDDALRRVLIDYAKGRTRQSIHRRPRRFVVDAMAELAVDQAFAPVRIRDLSRDGALVITNQQLSAGNLVALRLVMPRGGEPFIINAEVASHHRGPEPGIGLRFVVGEPAKRQQLDEYVAAVSGSRKA